MLKAPAFLFPTSIAIIDDDTIYPTLLINKIKSKSPIRSFSKPDFFLKEKDKDFIFLSEDVRPTDEPTINMLIQKTLHEHNNNLSDMLSVLIVDLHMNPTNGLELLYQIKSPFIYKVLISNFIDSPYEQEIKHAQNMGYIDAVLEKGVRLKEELPPVIINGQLRFFSLLGNRIYANAHVHNYLSDAIFIGYFLKLIKQLNPTFIWPNENLNTFRFEESSTNQIVTLFITNEDEIKVLLEGQGANTASEKDIKQLKSGDFMLCCKNPHLLDGTEWPYYLRPANKIRGSHSLILYNTFHENSSWNT
jgi:hypothetical protein